MASSHGAGYAGNTLFLVKQKMLGRKQWPMLSVNDLVTALAHMLPRKQLTAEELAEIIHKRHQRDSVLNSLLPGGK
jgi:hypothetical protein